MLYTIFIFLFLMIFQNAIKVDNYKIESLCQGLIDATLDAYVPWKESYIYKLDYIDNGFIIDAYDEYLNNYKLLFDYTISDCIKFENMEFKEIIKGHKFILQEKNCKKYNMDLRLDKEKLTYYKHSSIVKMTSINIPEIKRMFPPINKMSKILVSQKFIDNFPNNMYISFYVNPETGKISRLYYTEIFSYNNDRIERKELSRQQFIYIIQYIREYKYEIKLSKLQKKEIKYIPLMISIVLKRQKDK